MSVPVRHLIAGAFVEGLGAQRIPVSNPLDNSTLAEIACASAEQIEQAVASARETFANWKETPVSERARVMLLSLIHISEPTRPVCSSRMPSSA